MQHDGTLAMQQEISPRMQQDVTLAMQQEVSPKMQEEGRWPRP